MTDFRAMLLFIAVHFAALAVGAWAVLSPQAALLLAWPALMLVVLSIPPRLLGQR
jgi:hypothetical protein